MPREGVPVKYWLLCRHCRRGRACLPVAEPDAHQIGDAPAAHAASKDICKTRTGARSRVATRKPWAFAKTVTQGERKTPRVAHYFIVIDDEVIVGRQSLEPY